MNVDRMLAITRRELLKFFRSPALMLLSMLFPMVQLAILGHSFGGRIRNTRLAVVDQDHGPQALHVLEMLRVIEANAKTFRVVTYEDQRQAVEDVKNGKVDGAMVIPPEFSRKLYRHTGPVLGLVVDNTDVFISGTYQGQIQLLVNALNAPVVDPRLPPEVELRTVELYPFIEYIKYLLPGSITLAVFVAVMLGGGIVYLDDKSAGLHEGYLATPVTRLELVLGFNTAGAIKATAAGIVITVVGSFLAGLTTVSDPLRLLSAVLLVALTSTAFICFTSLLMTRTNNPMMPRAMFSILNTLLFFSSGAIYPTSAFPPWLRFFSRIDPFTYAVHGFKALLLKDTGFTAVWPDLIYLLIFTVVCLAGTAALFKRTL